jgi:hypothetical protein
LLHFSGTQRYVLHTKTVHHCVQELSCAKSCCTFMVWFFMQDLNDSQCLFVCLFVFQPMKLHLVSDCYIGLDQEYEIRGSSWLT